MGWTESLRFGAGALVTMMLLGGCGGTFPGQGQSLPEGSVVIEDPSGDEQGGTNVDPDSRPPGVDLVRVEKRVQAGKMSVTFESSETIADPASSNGLRDELKRAWWWVRFWNSEDDEHPDYLLSVSIDPLGKSSDLVVVLCNLRGKQFCSEWDNLLDIGDASVEVDDTELTVTFATERFDNLRAPYQWASLVTLNVTHNSEKDWWDFVPDWPRGSYFQGAQGDVKDSDSGEIRLGEDADKERQSLTGPPHPDPDSRAWFP